MTATDARIARFERELDRRCSTHVEPTAYGTAYVNVDFFHRWDSNFVLAERDGDAYSLAADSDRALGEHGLTHGKVVVDGDTQRLTSGFLELGWGAERLIRMVQARDPERRPDADVEETDHAGARAIIEATIRAQPYADSEEVIEQLVSFRGLLEREVGARFFVASVDGLPASVCEAYVLGDVGQVEDVNTLEAYRGRGLASAVVLAAARWTREVGGADLVYLVAADEDWPKHLYRRLGFDERSAFWSFVRTPG